jgi:hypothetical protein
MKAEGTVVSVVVFIIVSLTVASADKSKPLVMISKPLVMIVLCTTLF